MSLAPGEILRQYWKYNSFRGEQENIINSVLASKDTLALLPTGGGKSICFQVPALMKPGLCLVISPLIALMKDQVENLALKNIPALAIHSGMQFFEVKQAFENATYGAYKLLYLSPERLESQLFREYLPALDISLIAVDEAHCISQWGYDFRPPYLRIAALREELPGVPVLALTASATPIVQEDITRKLLFKEANIFRQSFDRPNLSYSAFNVDSKINKVTEILNNVKGSSIIYSRNRRQTKKVAELLSLQHLPADYYHAGLAQEERSRKQHEWINGATRTIVCTNAFGMGIDKADVRSVIHYDVPDCLENYYQEAGRAGRDGKKAYAVALIQPQDIQDLQQLPAIRFPSIPDIKKVYQAIADFLHIPVGLGEGNYYDFDLVEFSRNFKLEINMVVSVLKALEQEGHLAFTESIFLPSQVNFVAPKEVLAAFEYGHPELEPIIKCLLRTYDGIYDNRVSINEKLVAKLCRLSFQKVQEQLSTLKAFSIIKYLPQKETPQVYFMLNRAPAQHLHINHDRYLARKKLFQERVNAMIDYLQLSSCRAKFIAEYFGEVGTKNCGVCDNCLKDKTREFNEEEFKRVEKNIYANIPKEGIQINDLLRQLADTRKENIWKVLEFLQGERKLVVDHNGLLKLPS